jgi:hypothetical protein
MTRPVIATSGAVVAWGLMAWFVLSSDVESCGSGGPAALMLGIWAMSLAWTVLFVVTAVGRRSAKVVVPVSIFLLVALTAMVSLFVLACG